MILDYTDKPGSLAPDGSGRGTTGPREASPSESKKNDHKLAPAYQLHLPWEGASFAAMLLVRPFVTSHLGLRALSLGANVCHIS